MSAGIKIFAGRASIELAEKIAASYGVALGDVKVTSFSDGEFQPSYEETVRGQDVFIIQSTMPPADNIFELLLMVDAAKRASARKIIVVIPYFGFARQDRKDKPRVAIGAKLIANMMMASGIDRIMTMDLHADQIQGFFDCPVDNVYASPVLLGDIWKHKYQDLVVVSPDVGGVVRARALAKHLDVELAIIDKRRPRANVAKVMNIIGEVEGRVCVLIDDMVDTAGTLCAAAEALKEKGATRVVAYCTHPILSGDAVDNIDNSVLDELVVTDTIPLQEHAQASSKIRLLSIAEMLAEAMNRISNEESVSSLYMD